MTRSRPQSCSNRRLLLLQFVLSASLLGGLGYACLLQLGFNRDFDRAAALQHLDSIVPLAGRGRILDTKGRALALTRTSFQVKVFPTLLRNANQTTSAARILSDVCGRDPGQVRQQMDSNKGMYWFSTDLDYGSGDRLRRAFETLSIKNDVVVELQKRRLYPYAETLGSLLGFAIDDDGKAGLEQVLDPVLVGIPGKIVVQKDGRGSRCYFPAYPEVQPINGADVKLTIDLDFQRIAFEELGFCVDSFRADGGSVVVLDCGSGEIKAMCDYPYVDPRRTAEKGLTPTFRCRACEESFEPGSVFKPVLGLAALESDDAAQLRNMKYDVSSGVIEINGRKIHDVHPAGIQDFPGIFIHSSNVGLSMVSMLVERSRYYETMRKLGFGSLAGIEVPREDSGYLDPEYRTAPARMSNLRVANNAFGQGLRATLLQLAWGYSAVANDGLLRRPFLVKSVRTCDGMEYGTEPLVLRRAVSAEAALEMKDILERAVTEGTGQNAGSPYFRVCGKTGTAEKALPGRGYADGQIIATFVGFFPRESPKYLVAISIDNPKFGKYASTIACPTFRRIAERCWFLDGGDAPLAITTGTSGLDLPTAGRN